VKMLRNFTFSVFACLLLCAVPMQIASAAVAAGCDKSPSFLGFPTWYKYLDVGPKDGDPCAITGPLKDGSLDFAKAAPRIGLAIVEILLRISGMVAVGFIIYGGFRFLTSQGEPEAYKMAQKTVISALIGLVIAIMAVTIVSFVGGAL
jgi:hypothetical protein